MFPRRSGCGVTDVLERVCGPEWTAIATKQKVYCVGEELPSTDGERTSIGLIRKRPPHCRGHLLPCHGGRRWVKSEISPRSLRWPGAKPSLTGRLLHVWRMI